MAELLEPWDGANQALAAEVCPAEWPQPTPRGRYHLVVLGGGTAGLVSAIGAAGLGARVALVERRLLGGDCLNFGCVPSKALLASAKAFHRAANGAEFGCRWDAPPRFDFAAAMERMRRLRAGLAKHDSAQRLASLGIDVYLGAARFVGPRQVQVGDRRLDFWRAIIATGGRPALPPGFEAVGALTNETVFSLTELPRRLIVLGGGPIGCELAQAFRRFGSEVCLVQRADRLLVKEDGQVSRVLEERLRQEGVSLHLRSSALTAARHGAEVAVEIEGEGGRRTIQGDALLAAVGRRPNVEGLGLDAAGIVVGSHGILVNDRLQSTNRAVYAAGDVCTRQQFTHAADAMARICLRNALFHGRQRFSRLVIPRCTYTDPEAAHVGLTEHEARQRGLPIESFRCDLSRVDRAVLDGETAGFAVVHVQSRSGRIVGATMVAAHAGETIGEIAGLVVRGGRLADLASVIHCYPTQVEALKKIADDAQRQRLTTRVAWLFRAWFRWHE